jgi:ubiquinone/menaquinone biosynthesis C-methylase UbiE
MLREFLVNLKKDTEYLNFGRDIVASWAGNNLRNKSGTLKVLDIGVGSGTDLMNIKNHLEGKDLELFGIECYKPSADAARSKGITVFEINIEREKIPAQDSYYDVVVCNQIIEHAKEIVWIFSEIRRVLKNEGIAIIGVPNMAAMHNRFALLFGQQPTCVEILGPHVRGFTRPSFERFITCDGYYRILDFKGSNFYPFPPVISKPLSRFFPTYAVGIFFLVQKTNREGYFSDILKTRFFETPYYTGDR